MSDTKKIQFTQSYARELVDRMPAVLQATAAALDLNKPAFLRLWAACLQWRQGGDERALTQWAALQLWSGAQTSPWWKALWLVLDVKKDRLETNAGMLRRLQDALNQIADLVDDAE